MTMGGPSDLQLGGVNHSTNKKTHAILRHIGSQRLSTTWKITFRCDIPVVFHKLNTKYITNSQNTTKSIVLCCTICFITTCFGPFL